MANPNVPSLEPDEVAMVAPRMFKSRPVNHYRMALIVYSVVTASAIMLKVPLNPIEMGALGTIWLALALGSMTQAVENITQSLVIEKLEQTLFLRTTESAVKELREKTNKKDAAPSA